MRAQEPEFTATTPIGYWNVAEAYRAGAQLLARDLKGHGGWSSQPTKYLYYHAIEIHLKAPISTGMTAAQLRGLSHGFRKLVDVANGHGFGLVEATDLQTIDNIDRDGNYIKARYHHVGYFRVATIQSLDMTAHEIAFLTTQMLRSKGLPARSPAAKLPFEYRFQTN